MKLRQFIGDTWWVFAMAILIVIVSIYAGNEADEERENYDTYDWYGCTLSEGMTRDQRIEAKLDCLLEKLEVPQ